MPMPPYAIGALAVMKRKRVRLLVETSCSSEAPPPLKGLLKVTRPGFNAGTAAEAAMAGTPHSPPLPKKKLLLLLLPPAALNSALPQSWKVNAIATLPALLVGARRRRVRAVNVTVHASPTSQGDVNDTSEGWKASKLSDCSSGSAKTGEQGRLLKNTPQEAQGQGQAEGAGLGESQGV